MATVIFQERVCTLDPGESVLDGLGRHGVSIPSSCRAGTCQSCVVQATDGPIPAAAQAGIKDTWKRRGYFLACVCKPEQDLSVQLLGDAETTAAAVTVVERLSPTVTRLLLAPARAMAYEPGQYVSLIRGDGLTRSYSLASVPDEDTLELHVRHMAGGQMSSWIHQQIAPGDAVQLRGPLGECFYTTGEPDGPLLLCGTGTGLAPLWGIARHALRCGHRGPIVFMHGARTPEGLYMREQLERLAGAHASLRYMPCVLAGGGEGITTGALDELARQTLAGLGPAAAVRAYLCGDPDLVRTLQRTLFISGMSRRRIMADAFIMAPGHSVAA